MKKYIFLASLFSILYANISHAEKYYDASEFQAEPVSVYNNNLKNLEVYVGVSGGFNVFKGSIYSILMEEFGQELGQEFEQELEQQTGENHKHVSYDLGARLGIRYYFTNVMLGVESDIHLIGGQNILKATSNDQSSIKSNDYTFSFTPQIGYRIGKFTPYISYGFSYSPTNLLSVIADKLLEESGHKNNKPSKGRVLKLGASYEITPHLNTRLETIFQDVHINGHKGYNDSSLNLIGIKIFYNRLGFYIGIDYVF